MKLGILGIDQHGNYHKLKSNHPRKELQEMFNKKHIEKMYVDKTTGESKHIGYIIDGLWINLYEVHEWQR